nr:MAG TPA: hypothetical protein [Caudoviricetes sp.]
MPARAFLGFSLQRYELHEYEHEYQLSAMQEDKNGQRPCHSAKNHRHV